jgi:hypothetical protein
MSTYLTPFTPIPPFFDAPAAAECRRDQSSILAFLMNDEFATDALFAYGDNTAPAFSGVPFPPAAAPPAAAMNNDRKRALTPTADDEAAVPRSAAPASPANSIHQGGCPSYSLAHLTKASCSFCCC